MTEFKHLPTEPLPLPDALPAVVGRDEYLAARAELLPREKAHTREGDAVAAARRRLPMTQVPDDATIEGPLGRVPFVEAFEGRRLLVAYFHMWHDGEPWEAQCEGCTHIASNAQWPLAYLHARDVTLAVFSEGPYAESKAYADFLGHHATWWSARDSDALLAGRHFGMWCCYLRDDDGHAYETYWTTNRGTEVTLWDYGLLDMTVFGRQESWQEGVPGDVQVDAGQQWRVDGRPTVQWLVTGSPPGRGGGDGTPAARRG